MKYLLPFSTLIAGPAFAHSAPLSHSHNADWMVIVGLAVIAFGAVAARVAAIKVRK